MAKNLLKITVPHFFNSFSAVNQTIFFILQNGFLHDHQ